jgi:flagellar biosynthesis/type III secretory pathway protein FliH
VTLDTLWFRLLGRGTVQQQAVRELVALPPENLVRRNVLEIIYRWRISVMIQQDLTEDDQELIMNLTEAYQEARAQAVQEGVQQGQRLVVENLLRYRFGSVDEELSRVIDSLLQFPAEEFTPLCLQLSREELLARFSQ